MDQHTPNDSHESDQHDIPTLSDIIFSDPRCLAYLEAARPYARIPKKAYHQLTYKLRLLKQSQIHEFSPSSDNPETDDTDSDISESEQEQ